MGRVAVMVITRNMSSIMKKAQVEKRKVKTKLNYFLNGIHKEEQMLPTVVAVTNEIVFSLPTRTRIRS